MDITKYPQFDLYRLTLNLLNLKTQILPQNCDERCVNATIINRAYFSAYLFCELWLDYEKQFKILEPWEFDDGEEIISEHKQVRKALFKFGETSTGYELSKLSSLRKKADYEPFIDLTSVEVENAVAYMEKIFNNLKFQ
ncbi:MAG: hypothetical protein IJF83_15420 [Methanobrevibacter sp.]|nr:hypothetical protein [Methanobrevibacter sp.]